MSYQQLKEDASSALSKILSREDSGRFRCHDIARLLRNELIGRGYEVFLKDGIVQYDVSFLIDIVMEEDNLFREYLQGSNMKFKNKKTQPTLHSWCEIGDVIAEYHSGILVSSDLYLYGVEIIKKKEDFEGKATHLVCGKEFGINNTRFIYFPPYHFIKLRMPRMETTRKMLDEH